MNSFHTFVYNCVKKFSLQRTCTINTLRKHLQVRSVILLFIYFYLTYFLFDFISTEQTLAHISTHNYRNSTNRNCCYPSSRLARKETSHYYAILKTTSAKLTRAGTSKNFFYLYILFLNVQYISIVSTLQTRKFILSQVNNYFSPIV